MTFRGKWHTVTAAGINPLPVQRPIPIWFGGTAEAVIRRVGRMGDGWYATMGSNEEMAKAIERMRGYAREAGRDPSKIGIESNVKLGKFAPEESAQRVEAWRKLGATHVTFNTMSAGLKGAEPHINAIRRYKAAVGKG